ncbi:MAG: DUF2256 domain-containing protein [Bdellovibrionales bacterium]|nr:DUF2256 domain-containing protein [Bdellovibrionales bacterium]
MRKKSDLPQKDCAVCGRPFSWRRKWRTNWEVVRYCSERCRRRSRAIPSCRKAATKTADGDR